MRLNSFKEAQSLEKVNLNSSPELIKNEPKTIGDNILAPKLMANYKGNGSFKSAISLAMTLYELQQKGITKFQKGDTITFKDGVLTYDGNGNWEG